MVLVLSVRYLPHLEFAWCNTRRLQLGRQSVIDIHSRFAYALHPRVQSDLDNDLEKTRTCVLKTVHFLTASRPLSVSEIVSGTFRVVTRRVRFAVPVIAGFGLWMPARHRQPPHVCACPPRALRSNTETLLLWCPLYASAPHARIRRGAERRRMRIRDGERSDYRQHNMQASLISIRLSVRPQCQPAATQLLNEDEGRSAAHEGVGRGWAHWFHRGRGCAGADARDE
ncbi:hypothetical protein C8R45DRAFT_158975 [Mycena sanguinolenta]|nr:hypothetical protein C8R45DRAFT_158975 [Mycena sanguinolenta]